MRRHSTGVAATASLHPASSCRTLGGVARRLQRCRLCDLAGEPVESRPIADVRPTHRALIIGQAPGITEPALRRPFAGDAGRRLRSWFAPVGLDDEAVFRETFAMSAVMRCYPGRDAGARGDRRPRPGQLARCAPWTEATLRLLDPLLVIPVGGLAIASFLGPARLVDVVGQRFERDGRVLVPLPHPSGASAWANDASNRGRIREAVALIAAELRLPG
jgi:uracil-DNA glycosylase